MTDPTEPAFNDELLETLSGLAADGLTPEAALRVLALLIAEAPEASRQKIDQLKIMDKLLNTSRALMETRLKTGEAEELNEKVERLLEEVDMVAQTQATTVSGVFEDALVKHGKGQFQK